MNTPNAGMHFVWPNLLNVDPDDPALNWQPLQPSVDICRLQADGSSGISTALLRYQPGASVPLHMHVGYEYLLILRGSQSDESGFYSQGTFIVNPPDTRHQVQSAEGCLVLAVWQTPVKFIE